MPKNVEIKARIEEEKFGELRAAAKRVATDGPIELSQTDTFFLTQRGRLKVREFGDATAELIFYERPDSEGPKTSDYIRSPCDASVKLALTAAYQVTGVVEKQREVFFVDQTRVHLDQVKGLGTYLELEVVLTEGQTEEFGEAVARQILRQLKVDDSALVAGAYVDLLQQGLADAKIG